MHTTAPLLGEPIAVELMNTIWADREGVYDALGSPEQARAWLLAIAPRVEAVAVGEHPTTTAPPTDALAGRLRALRDALRRLAAETTADPRAVTGPAGADLHAAVTELNRAAAHAPSWSSLQWSHDPPAAPVRIVHTAASPEAALISQIAEQGIE